MRDFREDLEGGSCPSEMGASCSKWETRDTWLCLKTVGSTSNEWGALFVFKLFISFSLSVRDSFERKAKIAFLDDCFDTWMILLFRYRG